MKLQKQPVESMKRLLSVDGDCGHRQQVYNFLLVNTVQSSERKKNIMLKGVYIEK